jgi:hypothetical protein
MLLNAVRVGTGSVSCVCEEVTVCFHCGHFASHNKSNDELTETAALGCFGSTGCCSQPGFKTTARA